MATVAEPILTPENRFLLTDVSWEFYLRCSDELEASGNNARLTYNEGRLEFMVVKSPHEFFKTMLTKLVEMMIFEERRPVCSGGSLTIRRYDLKKGFEPDECWWLENAAKVRGKKELDFTVDPPPDLAVEVEISSSLADRIDIYAAVKVPEIWRFDGHRLRFCVLDNDGNYIDQETSLHFPQITPSRLTPYLKFDDQVDETARLHAFVEWFRSQQE